MWQLQPLLHPPKEAGNQAALSAPPRHKVVVIVGVAAKPVLATNILSHTQILNEENAFLVDEDVANLANGLRTLSHDQTLREKLGKAAGELSVSNFSRESLRDKIMGAYAEMTSKSNDSIVHERSL